MTGWNPHSYCHQLDPERCLERSDGRLKIDEPILLQQRLASKVAT